MSELGNMHDVIPMAQLVPFITDQIMKTLRKECELPKCVKGFGHATLQRNNKNEPSLFILKIRLEEMGGTDGN
jgi:hypothetical protein